MEQQKLSYFKYEISSREPRNALSQSLVESGLLVKINGGFCCIHPHTELGDPPLEDLIADLRSPRPRFAMSLQALSCAAIDANARKLKKSLFENLDIPKSHFLLSSSHIHSNNFSDFCPQLKTAGFDTIKVKLGKNLDENLSTVKKLFQFASQFKWRLDFNESLSKRDFQEFIQNLSSNELELIEFIEDPFAYHPNEWALMESHYPIRLAKDKNISYDGKGYTYLIHKSAKDNIAMSLDLAKNYGKKLVVTHYMEHPLGIYFSAYEAAKLSSQHKIEECGLVWPDFFEYPESCPHLAYKNAQLLKPNGFGLGMDEYLKSLEWISLS